MLKRKSLKPTDYLALIFILVAVSSVLVGEHVHFWASHGLTPIFLLGGALLALVFSLANVASKMRTQTFDLVTLLNILCAIYAADIFWAMYHLSNIWLLPSN